MLNTETVKLYLRVTDSDEDELITSLLAAAESLIQQQSGKSCYSDDSLYELAAKMLVSHWYDNRGMTQYGNVSEIPLSAQAIIDHIKLDSDYT